MWSAIGHHRGGGGGGFYRGDIGVIWGVMEKKWKLQGL